MEKTDCIKLSDRLFDAALSTISYGLYDTRKSCIKCYIFSCVNTPSSVSPCLSKPDPYFQHCKIGDD